MSSPRPLIGLNMDDFSSGGPVTGIRPKYYDAVLTAGGVPVCIPHFSDPDQLSAALAPLHGFILTGGDDIPGERFGEATGPTCVTMSPEREHADFALLEALAARSNPVLAICLGFQELNVWRGGTMIQDIIHERPDSKVAHYSKSGAPPDHLVHVVKGSKLAAALGESGDVLVNSSHHQAVRDLGRGLTSTATAPDGIIEGMELTEHPFFVGVQWHPEAIVDRPHQLALFKSLVNESRKFV